MSQFLIFFVLKYSAHLVQLAICIGIITTLNLSTIALNFSTKQYSNGGMCNVTFELCMTIYMEIIRELYLCNNLIAENER